MFTNTYFGGVIKILVCQLSTFGVIYRDHICLQLWVLQYSNKQSILVSLKPCVSFKLKTLKCPSVFLSNRKKLCLTS